MAEWEEKLNTILGDPQAMEQILSIARSLTGGEGNPPNPTGSEDCEEPPAPEPRQQTPSSPLSGLDPRLLGLAGRLMQEYSAVDDRKTALLTALRPFLRAERHAKLDRAVQIARLSRVVRVALQLLREPGEEDSEHV